jgi:hypothetical protein
MSIDRSNRAAGVVKEAREAGVNGAAADQPPQLGTTLLVTRRSLPPANPHPINHRDRPHAPRNPPFFATSAMQLTNRLSEAPPLLVTRCTNAQPRAGEG